jgi:uncharacterized protein YkwD
MLSEARSAAMNRPRIGRWTWSKSMICILACLFSANASASNATAQRELNDIRRQIGLIDVRPNAKLTVAAQTQAQNIANRGQLSHSIGGSLRTRVQAAGFSGVVGENLASGQKSVSRAIIDWMHSPGHRANILNGVYSCFGIGQAKAESGKNYWVLILGRC